MDRLVVDRGAMGGLSALALVLAVVALIVTAGCRERTASAKSSSEAVDRYGQLPGLKGTGDRQLLAELARIVEERGTPELLVRPSIPDSENVAAGLVDLIPAEEIRPVLAESAALFPAGPFTFNPIQFEKAVRFRNRWADQQDQARQAIQRPKCSFKIRYDQGLRADLGCLDVVRIVARWEAFAAAESLADDDLEAAAESLGRMLRLAACLGAEPHPTARIEAASLRREALAVLGSIAGHSKITARQLGRLFEMLQGHLAAWPSDAEAWIGERALGLYAYELIRGGEFMDLLTNDETARFEKEGILEELPAAVARTVNQDELYYLQAMRKILEQCDRPYCQRVALFDAMRNDWKERQDRPDYPVVAARLLLPAVERGQRLQARDRAACEAWALALALAAEKPLPAYQTNPLTGKAYDIARREGRIEIRNVDQGEDAEVRPVVVHDPAG